MNPDSWNLVLTEATVATCGSGTDRPLQERCAVALAGERIAWLGPVDELPPLHGGIEVQGLRGALVTPGLVDCHTHLVFAGNRAGEFAARQRGASYEDIARAGGGILSTVRATREADEETLLTAAMARARALMAEGVTAIEIKSGYGLDLDNELKLLRVARRVGQSLPVTVHTTLLAAHAVPPEFAGRADDYVDLVVDEILPAAAAAGLADSVDAFCETIAFSPAQVRRVFDAARHHGLPHLAVQGEVDVLDLFVQGDGHGHRVRQDKGAVAQGVGADGQQEEVAQGGIDNGSAGGQVVGGGAGGGGDDEPVGPVNREVFPVDPGGHLGDAGQGAFVDHRVV